MQKLLHYPFILQFSMFILLTLLVRGVGGHNENSRYATIVAMTEQNTFQIDSYYEWTIDWSQTPDGHYYSNKAPGPAFIAYPLYKVFDILSSRKTISKEGPGPSIRVIISFLTQVLPFCIFLYLILMHYYSQNLITRKNSEIALFLILFCNILPFYLKVYFGHAMASMFLLAAWYFYLKRNYPYIGLCLGFALLSDYSSALSFPFFFYCLFKSRVRTQNYLKILIGSLAPMFLWIWYHYSCFGGILSLPQKFQNPIFLDTTSEAGNIGGVFSTSSRWHIAYELLFGGLRGILQQQPWIFFSIIIIIIDFFKTYREIYVISICIFILLFIMNLSFGGWHGGAAVGPRYMAYIFPFLGISIAFIKIPRWFAIPIITSFIFCSLIYSNGIEVPYDQINLNLYLLKNVFSSSKLIGRSMIYIVLSVCSISILRKTKLI